VTIISVYNLEKAAQNKPQQYHANLEWGVVMLYLT